MEIFVSELGPIEIDHSALGPISLFFSYTCSSVSVVDLGVLTEPSFSLLNSLNSSMGSQRLPISAAKSASVGRFLISRWCRSGPVPGAGLIDTPLRTQSSLPAPERRQRHLDARRSFGTASARLNSRSTPLIMAQANGPDGASHTWIGSAGASGIDLRSEWPVAMCRPPSLGLASPPLFPTQAFSPPRS